MGRRMPTLAVVAYGLDALSGAAEEGVDEGRLSHARRAEQCDRAISREVGFKAREAEPRHRADRVHGHARRHRFGPAGRLGWIIAQVGLAEQDRRVDASLASQGEVAFEPARVE